MHQTIHYKRQPSPAFFPAVQSHTIKNQWGQLFLSHTYVNFIQTRGALGQMEVQTAEMPQSKITTLMLGPNFIHYHDATSVARKLFPYVT